MVAVIVIVVSVLVKTVTQLLLPDDIDVLLQLFTGCCRLLDSVARSCMQPKAREVDSADVR